MNREKFFDMIEFYDNLDEVVGTITNLDVVHKTITIGHDEYKLTDSALEQALRRLGLTGTVRDFTRSNGTMDVDFINAAVARKIRVWNIRPSKIMTDNTYAFGVVSAKYERMPHYVVIEELAKHVNIDDFFDYKRSYVSEKNMRLYLKGIDSFEIDGDSEFLFGLMVRNSETGWGALGMSQFVERLVCSNGLTSKLASLSISKAHIGNVRGFYEDNLPKMVNPEPVINLITKAIDKPPIVESLDNLPRMLTKFRVRREHHEGIVEAWKVEKDLGLGPYGISNAISRYNDHVYAARPGFDSDEYYALANTALEVLSF